MQKSVERSWLEVKFRKIDLNRFFVDLDFLLQGAMN